MRRIVITIILTVSAMHVIAQVPNFGGGGVPNEPPSSVIWSGSATVGDCVKIAAVGLPVVLVDAGAACGTGPGCSPDGGTDWSNACDLPLLAALFGF